MEERAIDLKRAVREYGGWSGLARKLNIPLSTCHGWRKSGLPKWRSMQIAKLAEEDGKDVYKRSRRRATRRQRLR